LYIVPEATLDNKAEPNRSALSHTAVVHARRSERPLL
jgi:hypothetical protein